MALTKCKECGKEVSTTAKACPHCGAKVVRTSAFTVIVGGFFVLVAITMFAGHLSTESAKAAAAEQQARQAAAEKARIASLSPEMRAAEEKRQREKDAANREAERQMAADKKKADERVQRASAGAVLLKKSMRNPDSFKLESALVISGSGAVCYDYRAQNGFGGINAGHAVLAPDGKKFLTSDMDGFSRLWNKECANKSGSEVSAAIRWFVL